MIAWIRLWWLARIEFVSESGCTSMVTVCASERGLYSICIGRECMEFEPRWWEGRRMFAWRMRREIRRRFNNE